MDSSSSTVQRLVAAGGIGGGSPAEYGVLRHHPTAGVLLRTGPDRPGRRPGPPLRWWSGCATACGPPHPPLHRPGTSGPGGSTDSRSTCLLYTSDAADEEDRVD